MSVTIRELVKSAPEFAPARPRRAVWPEFPQIAWHGIVADYRDVMGPTTEAPDTFHFASFMTTVGVILGRRISIFYGNQLYPNLYTLCIGPTGKTHKTTAQRRANGLAEDAGAEFIEVPGIGSAEGLLERFPPTDGVLFLVLDEFTYTLAKTEMKGTATLEPALLKLYDSMPHYQFPTRTNPIEFRNPFFAISAATTPERLADHLRAGHVASGFANRFAIFSGTAKAPISFPPKPDALKRNALIDKLAKVRAWVEPGIELTLTEKARAAWDDFYTKEFYPRELSDMATQMTERIPDHVFKLATIYAALERTTEIDEVILERAIPVGRYLMQTAALVAGDVSASADARTEQGIIRVLADRGALTQRALHQAIGGRVTAERFHRLVTGMVQVGVLVEDHAGRLDVASDIADRVDAVDRVEHVDGVDERDTKWTARARSAGEAPQAQPNANTVNSVNSVNTVNTSTPVDGEEVRV